MKKINKALNTVRKEEQEEIPHLTLARVKSGQNKEQLQSYLQKIKDKEFGEMPVKAIILYESELTPQGPVYTVVEEFKLK